MKTRVSVAVMLCLLLVVAYVANLPSQPSFNGPAPGCAGSGCHTLSSGILSASLLPGLQVQLTLSGTTGNVAGELMDTTGTVVAVNDLSTSNPFTLTAPAPGRYRVDGGYKSPTRKWDSVWVTVTSSPTGVGGRGSETEPAEYRLEQNFPNPFNPATSIRYSLADESLVKLDVYNILGEKVSTLVDRTQSSGPHAVRADMADYPSGVYFYRIEATSVHEPASRFTETRSMVLMK